MRLQLSQSCGMAVQNIRTSTPIHSSWKRSSSSTATQHPYSPSSEWMSVKTGKRSALTMLPDSSTWVWGKRGRDEDEGEGESEGEGEGEDDGEGEGEG